MINDDAIWAPHLNASETLVWSAQASAIAARGRPDRVFRIALGIVSGALALAAAYRFIEAAAEYSRQANMLSALSLPLYFAFGLTLGVFSFFSFQRLSRPTPGPDNFAITNQRLLVLNDRGRLTNQIIRTDIALIDIAEGIEFASLAVTGRDQDETSPRFLSFGPIDLDKAAAVKARIHSIFPEIPT